MLLLTHALLGEELWVARPTQSDKAVLTEKNFYAIVAFGYLHSYGPIKFLAFKLRVIND